MTDGAVLGLKDFLDRNPMVGAPRKNARRFWTAREEKILRENFAGGGVPALVPLLPGRSANAIYQHASQLGLRSAKRRPGPRQRWQSNEHIDAVIVRAYAGAITKGAINDLARSLGRPRWWVCSRAQRLGCVAPRFKEPPWTEAEIQIIADRAHRDPATIRRALVRAGFARTETAIVVKLKRIGATREDPNHYTATGLGVLLGVDTKTVTRWIEKGWLKARRRGTERTPQQGGDQHWIHRQDARRFIVDNAAAVDIRKADKFWFIDLLANEAAP